MKALVAGWFSFEGMGATAGDILARDVVCGWLDEAGVPHEIATAAPFVGGNDWESARPSDFSHVIFVCGPYGNGEPITRFNEHFHGCQLIGIDLSMLQPLDEWNPFDLLLERDSSAQSHPDLSFLSNAPRVPVVGLLQVHPQREYRDRGRHDIVHAAIAEMLSQVEAAVVPIDTRLDVNAGGLRTSAEVESLIARMDIVVTTRLHGMVLALKNGVPAVVVDAIAGGAKVSRQAQTIGWPVVLSSDECSVDALEQAFTYCLSEQAREKAAGVARQSAMDLEHVRHEFIAGMLRA